MFDTIKQIFNPKNIEIRKRIIFTLLIGVVYFIGKAIQVPGTSPITAQTSGMFDLLNVMSGNALSQVSIFAIGITPYITASIVIQLLSMDVLPVLTRLSQEGETGRKKINQITRYFAVVLALLQGFSYALYFDKNFGVIATPNAETYMLVILTLTTGTCLLLWLADQITAKGIGNGVSFIIMIGIVSGLPQMMRDAFNTLYSSTGTTQEQLLGISKFALFILLYVIIIVFVVYVQEGVRRVAIQYSNRSASAYHGGGRNFIPLKVNSAGVIPVIFASAILGAPLIITSIMSFWVDTADVELWINKYLNYQNGYGFAFYTILIILFSYFYTFIQVNPDKLSENLQQSGSYVPGIRPGEETAKHFTKILYRLTFFGSLFLALIAGLPIIFANLTSMPNSVRIGGTATLIVVGVSLEMIRQIEQHVVGYDYEGYVTK